MVMVVVVHARGHEGGQRRRCHCSAAASPSLPLPHCAPPLVLLRAQASPYTFGMFILPVHFWTHLAMLFFTALWTTNIHDTLTGDTEPVMGSAYHTIHHTAYVNNYGQIFVLFDWLHDTLQPPKHRKIEWGWEARTPGAVGKAHEYQQAIASVASEVDAKKKA